MKDYTVSATGKSNETAETGDKDNVVKPEEASVESTTSVATPADEPQDAKPTRTGWRRCTTGPCGP